jgi:hypothetical protein
MPHRGRKNADQTLVMALACGATVEAAARSAGISKATAFRRLQNPEFCSLLKKTQADMVERTGGMLTASGLESVKTLLELQKPSIPAAVRLGAARSVLEIGMKVRERTDLEQRMAAMEADMAATKKL